MNDPPPPTGERIVAFAQAGKPKLAVFWRAAEARASAESNAF
jgi:hypothetical protein